MDGWNTIVRLESGKTGAVLPRVMARVEETSLQGRFRKEAIDWPWQLEIPRGLKYPDRTAVQHGDTVTFTRYPDATVTGTLGKSHPQMTTEQDTVVFLFKLQN